MSKVSLAVGFSADEDSAVNLVMDSGDENVDVVVEYKKRRFTYTVKAKEFFEGVKSLEAAAYPPPTTREQELENEIALLKAKFAKLEQPKTLPWDWGIEDKTVPLTPYPATPYTPYAPSYGYTCPTCKFFVYNNQSHDCRPFQVTWGIT
jgi:hypothetical protein